MILSLHETFTVGKASFFDSISATHSFGVTFEEDETTGYFYAVETEPGLQVLDALHIYNVAEVIDKTKTCTIQIAWSDNGKIASLLINHYCHAIFDFENKAGYCRNGFPEPRNEWTKVPGRILTDKMIDEIFRPT